MTPMEPSYLSRRLRIRGARRELALFFAAAILLLARSGPASGTQVDPPQRRMAITIDDLPTAPGNRPTNRLVQQLTRTLPSLSNLAAKAPQTRSLGA